MSETNRRRDRGDRSDRPLWLGPVSDERNWDHARLHKHLLLDTRLAHPDGPAKSIVLAVYFGLAMHAEIHTGCSRPSAETLGRYADCSERSVRRAFAVLEEVGYVRLRRRKAKAAVVVLLPPPELPPECIVRPEDEHDDTDLTDTASAVCESGLSDQSEAPTSDCESRPRTEGPQPRTDVPTNENQEREPRTTTTSAPGLVDGALLLHATEVVVGENDPTVRSPAAVARSRIAHGVFDDERQALTHLAARTCCSTPVELLTAWRDEEEAHARHRAEADERRRTCTVCDAHGRIIDDDTLAAVPCPSCTPTGASRASA